MALLLQLRTKPNHSHSHPFANPSLVFSTSSSYLRDLKHTLKQQQQQQSPQSPPAPSTPPTPSSSFPNSRQQQQPSLDEIRSNLSEFRRRTAEQKPAEPVSFRDLYTNRTGLQKPPEPDADSGSGRGGRHFSLDAIRDGLRKIGASSRAGDRKGTDPISLAAYKDALKSRPSDFPPENVVGGRSALPEAVFGREMRGKKERDESSAMAVARSEFLRIYSYGELGEKLRKLRPQEGKGKGKGGKEWFSIGELNERLMRLREMEEKEADSNIKGGVSFKDLRDCLVRINETSDEKSKKSSLQKFDILNQLGGTPAYFLDPPKEHLVEKFFHPDNMSSAEKLKIELAKVRDEFKMSESDCGSARVQVAQLTTKIKHLSAVLHKKDVHSRKGLLAMVQRRKRLLKYLRRTDWDSYCFVISKLGLRDNPDHSNKTHSRGGSSQATSS